MSSEVSLGATVAGFRVERLIGRGAMGAVYLTEDVHLRRKVALKVLAPELSNDDRFRRRFLLESQLAASLEHPNIVPIYAAGEVDGALYLAMKYVEGYDLRALLDSTERVDDERALRLSDRSPPRSMPRTVWGSSTATSSRRTSSSEPGRRITLTCRFRAREGRVLGLQPDGRARLRGHHRVHRSRADRGRSRRRAGGRLLARLHAVRDADRGAAVRPRGRPPGGFRTPEGAGPACDRAPRGPPGRRGRDPRNRTCERPGRPLFDRRRAARGRGRGPEGRGARPEHGDAADGSGSPHVPHYRHSRLHELYAGTRGRGGRRACFQLCRPRSRDRRGARREADRAARRRGPCRLRLSAPGAARRGRAPARGRGRVPTARDRDRTGCGRGRAGRGGLPRRSAQPRRKALLARSAGGDPRQRDGSDPRAGGGGPAVRRPAGRAAQGNARGPCHWSRSFPRPPCAKADAATPAAAGAGHRAKPARGSSSRLQFSWRQWPPAPSSPSPAGAAWREPRFRRTRSAS